MKILKIKNRFESFYNMNFPKYHKIKENIKFKSYIINYLLKNLFYLNLNIIIII
jgi:hypothetical protein